MKECFTYEIPIRSTASTVVGLSHRGSRVETHAAAANRKIRRREASQCGQPYSGPLGVFAMVEKENGAESIHYIMKDHLGSWTTITDANGNIVREQSFDAWGNMRDPDTWTGTVTQQPMFDRGFTGHEHLNSFGLINMNGRMYDPVMSSFLSVDNYVQCPDFSQNFNRYAYCLNNPLKYTDPSGELFGIDDIMFSMIVYGISSVVINGVVNTCAGRNFYDGSYGAFMGGITATAMGGVMGGAVSKLVGVGGFLPGGIVQGTSGLFGGYVGDAVGAWCNGGSLRDCMTAGLTGGAIGLGTGFVLGGIQGGIYAMKNGGKFWSGDGTILGEYSSSEYYGSTQEAQSNAVGYNISYESELNDRFLKIRIENILQVKEGDFNIETISTRGDISRYGLTKDGQYVNLESEEIVRGYTRQVGINGSSVYVSPKYATNLNLAEFKATVGHELIHGFHHFELGAKCNKFDSEVSAYRYSYRILSNAGSPEAPSLMEYMKKMKYDVEINPLYLIPF